MNISKRIELLEPEGVDLSGPWLLWAREPDQKLIASLNGLGQTTPVIVERGARPPRLIAGHARVLALRKLARPVMAVSAEADDVRKGLLYLASNTGRTLSSGLRLQALRYFQGLLPENELAPVLGPCLGLAPHEREWKLLCLWLRLPRSFDSYLVRDHLPLAAVSVLARLAPAELKAVEPFFSKLRWSRGRAVNFLTWLWETAQARACGLDRVLESEGFYEILARDMSPKDVMTRLSARARDLRYPTLVRLERNFDAAAGGLCSGTDWEIVPGPGFETGAVTLSTRIKDRDQLLKAARDLENMVGSGVWETLWHI